MSTVRTVSDTKRTFYSLHTRPINSLYRRVVEELMVEMHLLLVNVDFRYDPIFSLGVVTTFDRFMQGYRPEADQEHIFVSLCKALATDAHHYRTTAQRLVESLHGLSLDDLISWLNQSRIPSGVDDVQQQLQDITANPKFKYSRLFAIGLYTILEVVSPDAIKDTEKRDELLKKVSDALKIPSDKVLKDLELYLGNLDKMQQARVVMEDILLAERKKREQQAATPAPTPEEPDDEPSSEVSEFSG